MDNDTIDVLQDLIKTSNDGQKGYQAAAEDVKSPEIRAFLTAGAQRCGEGAIELSHLLRALGKEPPEGGTAAGALHRGWLQIKAGVTTTDLAIIEECERGEDRAKAVYKKALEKNLNADVRFVIERQYQGVLENHDRVHALRDRLREGAVV